MFKKLLLIVAMPLLIATAHAEANPLSVHVLNTQDGLPAAGVEVRLERQNGERWITLSTGMTNAQGRIAALYPEGAALEPGVYRVTFATGAWLEKKGINTFFPEIPVVLRMDDKLRHYHVPLLLSPYGYSTYRGN